ncbi:hypothetical protein BJX66DRAFT_73146 [Aspergillus keveii]|uniref:Uncharacterized protein n=1 Tax=Aspergillus keveii TaxID=714993 RepID=A0ABR4GG11_9EURO
MFPCSSDRFHSIGVLGSLVFRSRLRLIPQLSTRMQIKPRYYLSSSISRRRHELPAVQKMCLPELLFPPQTVVTFALAFTTFGRSLSSSFSFLPLFSSLVSRFLGGCFDITGIALWSPTTWIGAGGCCFSKQFPLLAFFIPLLF